MELTDDQREHLLDQYDETAAAHRERFVAALHSERETDDLLRFGWRSVIAIDVDVALLKLNDRANQQEDER